MLARKTRPSEDFAAVSETAAASAKAVEVSDSKLITQVLAEERERLGVSKLTPERAGGSAEGA